MKISLAGSEITRKATQTLKQLLIIMKKKWWSISF